MSMRELLVKTLVLFVVLLTTELVALGASQTYESETQESNAQLSIDEAKEAYLGMGVTTLPPGMASQLPGVIGKDRGVMVADVLADSPAAKGGMQQYDIVVKYNEQDVISPEQLVKLVRTDKPGSTVKLTCIRGGKEVTASVKLGEQAKREPVYELFRFPSDRLGKIEMPEWQSFQLPLDDPSHWSEFESMKITQVEKGKFKAEIEYKRDDKTLERKFEGTREEIREAVKADKELPDKVKSHLLSGLTQSPGGIWNSRFGSRFKELERELFHWPHRDF